MSAAPLRRRAPAPARRPAAPARRPPVPARPASPARALVRPKGALVLDRLLSGRLWIGLIFLLLVGIVFFNVDLLRMNRDIAVTAEKAETIKRQNARLRGDLARLGSSERIQKVAVQSGLVLPAPGEVRYLKTNRGVDARNALARLERGRQTPTGGVPPGPGGTDQEATQPTAVPPQTPAAPVSAEPVPQASIPQPTGPQAPNSTQPMPPTAPPAGQ